MAATPPMPSAACASAHEFFDARLETAGAVGKKTQFGNVAHAHALFDLEADKALGCFEARRRCRLRL